MNVSDRYRNSTKVERLQENANEIVAKAELSYLWKEKCRSQDSNLLPPDNMNMGEIGRE